MLHYHYIRKVRKTMNQYHYEVGDIVTVSYTHLTLPTSNHV